MNTYKHTINCTNCGLENKFEIPKGQRVQEFKQDKVCNNCGCDFVAKPTVREAAGEYKPIYIPPHIPDKNCRVCGGTGDANAFNCGYPAPCLHCNL